MGYREDALKAIRKLIFSGALPLGVKTSEREISESLGGTMSRTPVREALGSLTQTGVVVQYPQVGLMIQSVGLEEAIEALRLREALESVTVARLAVEPTHESLDSLHLVIKDLENAVNFAERVGAETNFHCEIAIHAGYRSAVQPLTTFMDKIALYRLVHGGSDVEASTLIEEHRAVAVAIDDADPDRAVDSLHAHLRVTEERLSLTQAVRASAKEQAVLSATP